MVLCNHKYTPEVLEIMGTLKKATMLLIKALVILPILLVAGCGNQAAFAPLPSAFTPLPYLPPAYYDCTQVNPLALVDTYFVGIVDITSVRARFDGVIFVFKDYLVNDRTFNGMDEGFIWVDRIKCYLTNLGDMNNFKSGDKIDVVGRNAGQTSLFIPGLTFRDCFVLPAGRVALPISAGSISGPFGGAY